MFQLYAISDQPYAIWAVQFNLRPQTEVATLFSEFAVMDARLREGIRLFNAGRFFESHEALEQFYQETEDSNKPFLEALIELAVAFRLHADFGEIKGPVRMIYQALIRLENYQSSHLEIRVKDLSQSMETWAKEAEATGRPPSPIPTIPLKALAFLNERF